MERCPNCGQLGRTGAKFCTICGHRLEAGDTGDSGPPEASGPDVTIADDAPSVGVDNFDHATWPGSQVGTASTEDPNASWLPSPVAPASGGSIADAGVPSNEHDEGPPNVWAADPTAGWPSPSNTDSSEEATAASLEEHRDDSACFQEDEPPDAEFATGSSIEESQPVDAGARDRALTLLDDLRQAIAAISGHEPPPDLSGVIEELEVAVTPPGAIGPDDLAELREALLAARERPRDIDTMVALTGRLDAMVALVFAYERAIAAIERSLETLRHR